MKHRHRRHKDVPPSSSVPRWRGRVWIESEGGTFLGYGRAVLLERIQEHGSIAEAARSMEMSYKHAWDLVQSMNRQAREPLVEKTTGGRGGGGARLTPVGCAAVTEFWDVYRRFQEFLTMESEKLRF
ncbi:MAG: LysR family transcriptional regulator [Deltaproteobacteria bacterium]